MLTQETQKAGSAPRRRSAPHVAFARKPEQAGTAQPIGRPRPRSGGIHGAKRSMDIWKQPIFLSDAFEGVCEQLKWPTCAGGNP